MQKLTPGSFILGAWDCNKQLREMAGHVSPNTGAIDRPMDLDHTDLFLGVLAKKNHMPI